MLTRQQCRRRDNRDLHAGHGCNKGRAHGNLGFAKAYVAANQPIHRLPRAHIRQDITNSAQLIVSFLIRETRREGVPHAGGWLHNRGAAQSALCRNADQLVRHLANTLFQLGLFRLPCPAAKTIKETFVVAIFTKQFNIFDRQVQPRVLCIIEQNTLMRSARCLDHLKPLVTANAVIHMHNQITGVQALGFGEEIFSLAAFFGAADETITQHILLGNDS